MKHFLLRQTFVDLPLSPHRLITDYQVIWNVSTSQDHSNLNKGQVCYLSFYLSTYVFINPFMYVYVQYMSICVSTSLPLFLYRSCVEI